MAEKDYQEFVSKLNAWHLELAMTNDVIGHLLSEVVEAEGPDWLSSAACLMSDRLSHLVKSCPFPDIHS